MTGDLSGPEMTFTCQADQAPYEVDQFFRAGSFHYSRRLMSDAIVVACIKRKRSEFLPKTRQWWVVKFRRCCKKTVTVPRDQLTFKPPSWLDATPYEQAQAALTQRSYHLSQYRSAVDPVEKETHRRWFLFYTQLYNVMDLASALQLYNDEPTPEELLEQMEDDS